VLAGSGCVMGTKRTRIIRFISLTLLLVMVFFGVGPGVARADPGWYNASWAYRKQITIDHTKVAATLTDFPVLISLPSDSGLAANAQDDGDDILFTTADGVTKLNHEIETFNGTSGQLVAWVKVTGLSASADTDIYMYYGNSGAGNQENASFVWDSHYQMVQHLQETTGGANAIKDSTANTNHGTDYNSPTLNAAGQINGGDSFDGSDDYIGVADDNSLDITASITLEAWIKPATVDTNHRRIVIKSHSSWAEPYYMYSLWVHSTGLGFGFYDGTSRRWATKGSITAGSWQYVAATYNGTEQRWFINGSSVGTENITGTIATNSEPLLIGKALDATTLFHGTIDEVRISSTARSAGWILTSYNNQSSPATFYSLGAEEAGVPAAVGGVVYPVNRGRILLPWLGLVAAILLAASGVSFTLRNSA